MYLKVLAACRHSVTGYLIIDIADTFLRYRVVRRVCTDGSRRSRFAIRCFFFDRPSTLSSRRRCSLGTEDKRFVPPSKQVFRSSRRECSRRGLSRRNTSGHDPFPGVQAAAKVVLASPGIQLRSPHRPAMLCCVFYVVRKGLTFRPFVDGADHCYRFRQST